MTGLLFNYDVMQKLMRLKSSVAPTNPHLISEYIDDYAPKPQVGKPQVGKSQVEKSQAENFLLRKPEIVKSQVKNYKKILKQYLTISNLSNPEESSQKQKSEKLAKVRLKTIEESEH